MKLLYKPVSLVVSALGGLAAAAVFRRVWSLAGDESTPPQPTDRGRSWSEIAAAAAVEGTIYSTVKALVDRAGAATFAKATGTWPA
jgi:hypothetical protein